MTHCPECGGLIDLEGEELEEGTGVSCPECDVKLEVVNTNPLELSVIKEADEKEDLEEQKTHEDEKNNQ